MPQWQIATALGIAFLVGLSTHVFYRRPPAALWPSLPAVFFAALIFAIGDLLANFWSQNETIRWIGMVLVYTGLLAIAPAWWLFSRSTLSRSFSDICFARHFSADSSLDCLSVHSSTLRLSSEIACFAS